MKFLIVGASGFIGSHLLRAANAAGYEVLGTCARTNHAELLPFDLRSDRIDSCLPAGFLDEDCHVVICSATSRIDRCFQEPEISRRVNVEGTMQLIDDVADRAASVVFLSTSHAFNGETGGYTEDDPTSPITEYGRQKVEVEDDLLADVSNSLVLRLDKVVGDRPGERHLFNEWWEAIQAGRPIRCIEGQVLSPTLVTDVANAVITGGERNLWGLYHVAAPEAVARSELAERFVRAAGADVEVVSLPVDAFGFDDVRPLRTHLNGDRFVAASGMAFTTMQNAMDRFLADVQ